MIIIKAYLRLTIFTILLFLFLNLFITTLHYFNILSSTIVKYLRPITLLLTIFISSYNLGKKTKKKGIIEGLIYGLIIAILLLIISLIFYRSNIIPRTFIYLLIIFLTTSLSVVFGKAKSLGS